MATILTSQIPKNVNPLSPNGYMFTLQKLPTLSYFCQEVMIPSISLQQIEQLTPFSKISVAGDQIDFSQLTIQFLIDEKMENYKAIHDWIIGLGFPEDYQQYTTQIQSTPFPLQTEVSKSSSDATLVILGNDNNAIQSLKFVDCIPQSLESITFTSTNSDVQYLVGSVTFSYSYYAFI